MRDKILKAILAAMLSTNNIFIPANVYAEVRASKEIKPRLKSDIQGLVEEITSERLQEEKKVLIKEKEDLLKEITSLKNLNLQLEVKAKEFYVKAQDTEQMKKEINNLSNTVEHMNQERLTLKKENERLQERIVSLEDTLQNERAMLYQELGTAYTQAKLFDLAIEAYEKSLSFNSRNPDVHYNLGLLYKHSRNNSKKAVYHFKKYLQLNPEAKNREEVKYLIEMLTK